MTAGDPDGRIDATRRRLLYLTPFPPSLEGAHGGSRVIAQLLDRVAQRHRVALMCLRHGDDPSVDQALRARLEFIEQVEQPSLNGSHGAQALRGLRDRAGLLSGKPLWASEVDVPAFSRRLAEVLAEWRPDLVQIQYTAMGVHLAEIERAGVPTVLWEPDPATHAAIDFGRASKGDRFLRRLDVRAWRRFERNVLGRAAAVVVFTGRDERAVKLSAGRTPVLTIPLGTDLVERRFAPELRHDEILFVGNFRHPPNVDAAMLLVREIFPRIRARRPESSLRIVGAQPPRQLLAASGDEHVTVEGRVPDVTPCLERAAVVAAPIRFGGGMRVKVLEALAVGKPLVASPLAVEGLGVQDRRQVLLATTVDEFVDQIARLLDDDDLRRHIAEEACAWAREHLGWDEVVAQYESLYDGVLRRA